MRLLPCWWRVAGAEVVEAAANELGLRVGRRRRALARRCPAAGRDSVGAVRPASMFSSTTPADSTSRLPRQSRRRAGVCGAQRRRDPGDVGGCAYARARPRRLRHDRQRHALATTGLTGMVHSSTARAAAEGVTRGARGPLGRGRRHGRPGGRRPLQDRRAAEVPGGGPRRRGPHRASAAPSAGRRSTRG